MAGRNNKDKTPVDESILEETPPNINEPQNPEDIEDPGEKKQDDTPPEEKTEEIEEEEDVQEEEKVPAKKEVKEETPEEKDEKYKSQQTEAQIQAAKASAIKDKIKEAAAIGDPTEDELRASVAKDGLLWDDLSTFEQSQAKRTLIAEKKFDLINQGVLEDDKIDAWAGKVDEFIDKTDGDVKYAKLSGHELEFRKFCMKEAHRSTPIEVLASAFINNIPTTKKRGALFETASGGEKDEKPGKMTDADEIANLRTTNPREYRRQLRQGKIAPEV